MIPRLPASSRSSQLTLPTGIRGHPSYLRTNSAFFSYAQTSITPLHAGNEARLHQSPPPALHPALLHRPHGLRPLHPGGFPRPPGVMRHVRLPGVPHLLQDLCLFRSLPALPRSRPPRIRRPAKPTRQTLARQPSPPRRPRYHLHQFLRLPLLQRTDPLHSQGASPDVTTAARGRNWQLLPADRKNPGISQSTS